MVGEPVDLGESFEGVKRSPIHRPAPSFTDQATEVKILETGIKVVDLLAPYPLGGKIDCLWCRCGQDRYSHGTD